MSTSLLFRAAFWATYYGLKAAQTWVNYRLGLIPTSYIGYRIVKRALSVSKTQAPMRTFRRSRVYRRAWPFRRGVKRKRRRVFTSRKQKRGFIPQYRKRAFVGRQFGLRALMKCVESKKFFTTDNNPITLSHTAGSDFQWFFSPTQGMTQGTGDSQFTNKCIWIRGISYKAHFGPVATDNDSYIIRFMVVRTRNNVNFSSSAWTETLDADTSFYDAVLDVDYATVTERMMLLAPPNRNSTVKILYDKLIHIPNTNTAAGCNNRFFRVWIPLNQIHNFQTDINDDLTTAPNFGSQGDIMFVLTWDNGSHMLGGTKKSLVIGGQQAIVYFKDG